MVESTEGVQVFEIDGPPMAYFEVHGDLGPEVVRLMYRSIRCGGASEEAVSQWMDAAIAKVRAWCAANDAFIIWRRRPTYHNDGPFVSGPRHKMVARLVTSRPLPRELWEEIETDEGAGARQV